jgi:signal transduction histidine kinase
VTAVERGDSEAVGDVIMLHEVTERKENEQKLRQQNEQLDQFASIVSHDLRNPLNVAKGHVELAQAGYDESLETAEQALDRMETLIEDTLTIARQSQTVEETTTVDVGALAREAWTNVDTAEATLVVDTDATVRADEGRLSRLFENLYRNSVEHGRADLTVRVGSLGDGFYVEDTGPGIPAAKREAVFEHGYTTDENGTGFGLSIVESAVDAHGWSITVTDGTDGGARFEITQHPGDGEQESSQNETEPSTR